MKILFAASECVPFIKTGGLADVVGALAPVLAQQGHDVRVILPLYEMIGEKYQTQMTHVLDFEVQLGWRHQYCGIEKLEKDGVTWYFVDNKFYFGRSYVYGLGGDEYERYGFYCRAVLNALPLLDFQPDVIHAHDWQAGMIPALLKIQYAHYGFYENIKTMFTIHNLQYQGIFGIREVQDVLGLGDSLWTNDKLECFGCANFMKAALVYSDVITTVSPSYSQEIQTAYYGERLDGLLRARHMNLFGVLNGLDVADYNPATDPSIAANYSAEDTAGKATCKRALQEKLGLEIDPEVPIIGMVGRLSSQKGLDLVDHILGDLMQDRVQLVVLGMGESRYVNLFSWAESRYPGRVAARFTMDHALAHQIYAGSDLFLMPSQFEPCGLSQMIALRYGTLPIVRETGGLRDTVLSYNEYTRAGNGFSFFNYNAHDMLNTIRRALGFYEKDPEVWQMLQKRGMTGDYSWTVSAQRYVELYTNLVAGVYNRPYYPEAEKKNPVVVTEEEIEAIAKKATATKKRAPRKPKAEGAAEETKKKTTRAKKLEVDETSAAAVEEPKKKTTRTRKAKAVTEEAVTETKETPKPARKPRAPKVAKE